MKKSAKQIKKPGSSSSAKKNTNQFTAEDAGYKEDVYNGEKQNAYEKSDIAKDNKKNTSGPKS